MSGKISDQEQMIKDIVEMELEQKEFQDWMNAIEADDEYIKYAEQLFDQSEENPPIN